jgi:hypothetical protein
VALEALRLDAAEHVTEVEVALAGPEVNLVPVAPAIGEADLRHPLHRDRVHEALHPLRKQVRVVRREGEREGGRVDRLVVVAPLLHRVREVVHLGVLRFLVQVLEQQPRAAAPRVLDHAFGPLESGAHPHLDVGGEVVAGVHHDPPGTQPRRGVDVALDILVHRLGHHGRVLRDVDRRKGVQPELHAVPLARRADAARALVVEAGEGVRRGVELDVDVAHAVAARPLDPILQPHPSAEVDPDPVSQRHVVSSEQRRRGRHRRAGSAVHSSTGRGSARAVHAS